MALGGVKAYYQIAFATDKDKSFKQSIQFWGLYVMTKRFASVVLTRGCVGSLQLNVGIIAACAPTLKPVLGKVLMLPTYGQNSNYNDISRTGRAARTADRSGGVSLNRASKIDTDFEMQRPPFPKANESYRTSIKGGKDLIAAHSVYRSAGADDRSESEEYILQGTTKERKNGIVMTTEITIDQ